MISIGCSGSRARRCRPSAARRAARCAAPPAGNPRRYGRAPAALAARNTGRPTFTATSWVGLTTPKVPPWPEQRSITSTGVSGNQPQHLGRLRAHVLGAGMAGQMHGDAFGQRLQARPAGPPSWRRPRHIRRCRRRCSATRFTSSLSGTISGHSNFSISPQDAVSATMS